MKKILLSLFCLVSLFAANAAEVTVVAADLGIANATDVTTVNADDNIIITFDKGTGSTQPKYYSSGSAIRCYQKNVITVTGSNSAITINSVVANCVSSGYVFGVGTTVSVGTLTNNGSVSTIADINANSLTITKALDNNTQTRIVSLVVTYTVGEATQVSTPAITPNGGEVTAESTIELTCATEGASIYYTIDGTEPSTASNLYTAPFSLSGPATVKAIAVDPAGALAASSVVSADFTFPVANIAEFISAANPHATSITGAVTVVAQSGSYLFLQDETSRIVAFGSLSNTYNNGDQLTGVKGSYTLYNGLPEMNVEASSFGTATAGAAVEPTLTTIDAISIDNLLQYIKIEGVSISGSGKSFTMTDAAGKTIAIYNTLGVDVITGDNIDVVGFISCYKTTVQVMPLVVSSKVTQNPVISPNGGEILANQAIEITCATEGAKIYYTIDGTDPSTASNLYSAPFTLVGNTTVKAIAIAEGFGSSEIVSADFIVNTRLKAATFDFTNPSSLTPALDGVPAIGSSSGLSLHGTTLTSGDITIAFDNGSATTDSRIWAGSSAYDFRAYNGSSFTVTAANGYVINAIDFEGNKVGTTYWNTSEGTADATSWNGGTETYNNVKFNVTKTCNVNSITVMYEEGIPTGVEDIIVDSDAPVYYFNLQGVQVANPENGIFIRVQGDKATKVIK